MEVGGIREGGGGCGKKGREGDQGDRHGGRRGKGRRLRGEGGDAVPMELIHFVSIRALIRLISWRHLPLPLVGTNKGEITLHGHLVAGRRCPKPLWRWTDTRKQTD